MSDAEKITHQIKIARKSFRKFQHHVTTPLVNWDCCSEFHTLCTFWRRTPTIDQLDDERLTELSVAVCTYIKADQLEMVTYPYCKSLACYLMRLQDLLECLINCDDVIAITYPNVGDITKKAKVARKSIRKLGKATQTRVSHFLYASAVVCKQIRNGRVTDNVVYHMDTDLARRTISKYAGQGPTPPTAGLTSWPTLRASKPLADVCRRFHDLVRHVYGLNGPAGVNCALLVDEEFGVLRMFWPSISTEMMFHPLFLRASRHVQRFIDTERTHRKIVEKWDEYLAAFREYRAGVVAAGRNGIIPDGITPGHRQLLQILHRRYVVNPMAPTYYRTVDLDHERVRSMVGSMSPRTLAANHASTINTNNGLPSPLRW